jgi:rhodanese-related sulfurtransferase
MGTFHGTGGFVPSPRGKSGKGNDMGTCSELSPQQVCDDRTIRLIDIRSADERYALSVSIPGSRFIAPDVLFESGGLPEYPATCKLCIVCLSGHRSCNIAQEVQATGFAEVHSMQGGLLGWKAAGLPTSIELPLSDRLIDVAELDAQVRSCFVSEAVENALDRDFSGEFDPRAMLEDLKLRGGFDSEMTRRQASDFLDALAEMARTLGHDMQRVAANLTKLRYMLARIELGDEVAHAEQPR